MYSNDVSKLMKNSFLILEVFEDERSSKIDGKNLGKCSYSKGKMSIVNIG
jgi:hypothetical protein